MDTFELPGPESVPCAVCEGTKIEPPCIKCGGAGVTKKMHAYTVTRHKPTEGLGLSLVCSAVMMSTVGADGTEAQRLARLEKVDQHQLMFSVLREFKAPELHAMFAHTARDGVALDPDVAYVDNYAEMTAAVVRVATINGFFGRAAST